MNKCQAPGCNKEAMEYLEYCNKHTDEFEDANWEITLSKAIGD